MIFLLPDYSALNGPESIAKKMKEDVDIGHLTYESACAKFRVKPRRRVLTQLWERTLSLPHGGLLTGELRALGAALKVAAFTKNLIAVVITGSALILLCFLG